MSFYNRDQRNLRHGPMRRLNTNQIRQIESTLQELEGEAAKWKELARKWEVTAKEERQKASRLEEQLQEQQEKIGRIQEQIAQETTDAVSVPDSGASGEETVDDVEDRLTQMEAHLAQAQAEYENARKRLERRFALLLDQNIIEFLRDLLPVLDNLDRAIEHTAGDADGEGVKLTRQMFLSTLDKNTGLSRLRLWDRLSIPRSTRHLVQKWTNLWTLAELQWLKNLGLPTGRNCCALRGC